MWLATFGTKSSPFKAAGFLITFLIFNGLCAQEFNGQVVINSEQVNQTNQQIFQTLERSLNDFVNKNRWTQIRTQAGERINVRFFFTFTNYEDDFFQGNLQVQSSRPVYNASYDSPIFNYRDGNVSFRYQEFQPLVYNPNSFDSNLVAIMSYYIYLVLGLDADTFAMNGGDPYYEQARKILTQAQGNGFAGWAPDASNRSRFELVDNLLSNTFREYRTAMYNYHRKGLDILSDNNSTGKQIIYGSIRLFENLIKRRPNAFLVQVFFDAKAEEIVQIFSDGPQVDLAGLKATLERVAPFYSSNWKKIRVQGR